MRITRIARKGALLGVLMAGLYAMPAEATNPPTCKCADLQAACRRDNGNAPLCVDPIRTLACVNGGGNFKAACDAAGGTVTRVLNVVICTCLLN